MTEDELDLLASLYVDGEATPEEVAMVERDPTIMARVQEFRSVSGQVGAAPASPPELMEQHLAAAMAVFDTEVKGIGVEAGGDSTVLDFQARARSKATAAAVDRTKPAKVGGLPSWMPAAAVFILFGGGILALVANNSGSDDADSAAEAFSTEESEETSTEDSETEAGSADPATESMLVEPDMAGADDAMADDDAMEQDEAMEDEEAMEEEVGESADEAAPSQASTTTARTGGGFFPQEPVLFFDQLPPDLYQVLTDELDNGLELRDPAESNCGPDLPLEDGNEVFGYVPVELAGLPAEIFATVAPSGEEFALLVDAEACLLIE